MCFLFTVQSHRWKTFVDDENFDCCVKRKVVCLGWRVWNSFKWIKQSTSRSFNWNGTKFMKEFWFSISIFSGFFGRWYASISNTFDTEFHSGNSEPEIKNQNSTWKSVAVRLLKYFICLMCAIFSSGKFEFKNIFQFRWVNFFHNLKCSQWYEIEWEQWQ